MAAGMFIFSAVDTQAKFLTDTLHPLQIVWSRQLGLFVGVVVLLSMRGTALLNTAQPLLQITRGALAVGSASLFIIAIGFVPLADAVAVSFVAPFIVTVMGAVILKEKVGPRRWIAVCAGFLGALIVIRPGLGVMHPAVFLVVIAAILFALRQVISRKLSDTDRTATTVAYTALVGTILLTIPLPFVMRWPAEPWHFGLLVCLAASAAVAEICVIKALEVAQAVVVAPVQYTLIIWGTFYGYVIFQQLPDMWTWIGTSVIIASGMYTIWRDSQVKATKSQS